MRTHRKELPTKSPFGNHPLSETDKMSSSSSSSSDDDDFQKELDKLQQEMDDMNEDISKLEKNDVIPEVQLVPGKKLFIKEAEGEEKVKGRVAQYNHRIVDYPLPPEWFPRTKGEPLTTTKVTIGNGETGAICWTNVLNMMPEKQ